MADRPAFLTHPSALSLQPSPDALSLPEWNGRPSRSRTRTGSPAGSNLRPDDRALPADAPGRRVRRQGLGNLPAQAPQPLDRRAAADIREDLVGRSDRRGASQEGSVVNVNPGPSGSARAGRSMESYDSPYRNFGEESHSGPPPNPRFCGRHFLPRFRGGVIGIPGRELPTFQGQYRPSREETTDLPGRKLPTFQGGNYRPSREETTDLPGRKLPTFQGGKLP